MSFNLFSGGGATILRRQLFTSYGNANWIRPASMLGDTVWITAIGGGGRAATGVGGRGGQFIQRLPVTLDATDTSVRVTVGRGGSSTAGAGRPSSFGSYVSVSGELGSPGNDQTFSGDGPPGPFGSGKLGLTYAGGGGLILDNTAKVYGAGARSSTGGSQPAEYVGDGAVLIEWMEAI